MSRKIKELAQESGIEPDEKAVVFAERILGQVEHAINELYRALPLETAVILIDLGHMIDERLYGEK
jgi:(p)ppGpp synthase/HD superfamily hydrolase